MTSIILVARTAVPCTCNKNAIIIATFTDAPFAFSVISLDESFLKLPGQTAVFICTSRLYDLFFKLNKRPYIGIMRSVYSNAHTLLCRGCTSLNGLTLYSDRFHLFLCCATVCADRLLL